MDVSSTSRTFSIHIVSIHKMQVMLKGLERILCRVVFLSMPRARFKYNLEKKNHSIVLQLCNYKWMYSFNKGYESLNTITYSDSYTLPWPSLHQAHSCTSTDTNVHTFIHPEIHKHFDRDIASVFMAVRDQNRCCVGGSAAQHKEMWRKLKQLGFSPCFSCCLS